LGLRCIRQRMAAHAQRQTFDCIGILDESRDASEGAVVVAAGFFQRTVESFVRNGIQGRTGGACTFDGGADDLRATHLAGSEAPSDLHGIIAAEGIVGEGRNAVARIPGRRHGGHTSRFAATKKRLLARSRNLCEDRTADHFVREETIMTTSQSPALPPGFPAMSIVQAHQLLVSAAGSPFEIEEREIRGVRIRTWKNAPPTLKEVHDVNRPFGARTYIVLEDERVTFDAHRAAVGHLAARLVADGVKKGDRVAIIMRNVPEWSVAFWAASVIGAIVTPLNAWWTGPELEYGLCDSGSKIALMDAERWERVREHVDRCPSLTRIYVSRSTNEIADPRVARLEDVIGAPDSWASLSPIEPPQVAIAPDDDAAIFYTSGTTGKPKGAIITHRNIISNFYNALCAQARSFVRRGEKLPAPDPAAPQKATLLSVPFFNATGCFAVMIPAMMGGTKLVLQRRWNADQALELIEREKINTAGGVPTIAWQIIEHPRFDEFDLSSLETISYGGAPSAPELVRRMKE